jgi:hypothetical protein
MSKTARKHFDAIILQCGGVSTSNGKCDDKCSAKAIIHPTPSESPISEPGENGFLGGGSVSACLIDTTVARMAVVAASIAKRAGSAWARSIAR